MLAAFFLGEVEADSEYQAEKDHLGHKKHHWRLLRSSSIPDASNAVGKITMTRPESSVN